MASEQAMALYRKLNSSGTAITNSNWREWERLASSAMKMPDFTPAGQSESLHDLANEVGIEIQDLKSRASRPGAKAKFKVEDRFYFGKGRKERFADDVTYSIAAHVGNEPVGHRSVRSLEEAKAIAKQMLASIKGNAKGKPVLVDVYPVVNGSPKPAVLTLRD